MNRQKVRRLVRNLVIELMGYGLLVVAYSTLVAPLLEEPLVRFFDNALLAYTFVGLGLIVVQSLILDVITSFLINQLRLDRLE
jgi:hypothetical protein